MRDFRNRLGGRSRRAGPRAESAPPTMKLAESPRLALLDRDGTLIDVVRDAETGTITTAFHPSQIRVLDGVVDGLRALVDAGYMLAIVTNQPGPAKGHFGRDAVERTNAALVADPRRPRHSHRTGRLVYAPSRRRGRRRSRRSSGLARVASPSRACCSTPCRRSAPGPNGRG